jgi:hypothetical protein
MIVPPCQNAGSEVYAGYLAGALDPAVLDEFESHMIDCAVCQRALRDAAAIRKAFRSSATTCTEPSPVRPWQRWPVLLAAAAVLLVVAREVRLVRPITRLGRVDPAPLLATVPTRASTDSAASLVGRGVLAYRGARYSEAAHLFAAADSLAPTPALAFYLGVSELLAGDAKGAIASLRPVMQSADGLYDAEAHFYSAKAWLRLAGRDSALAHLAAASRGRGALATHAAALADSVRSVTR